MTVRTASGVTPLTQVKGLDLLAWKVPGKPRQNFSPKTIFQQKMQIWQHLKKPKYFVFGIFRMKHFDFWIQNDLGNSLQIKKLKRVKEHSKYKHILF